VPIAVIFQLSGACRELRLSDQGPRTYLKELVHVGDFQKKDADGELNFSIDDDLLRHWKNTFDKMLEEGVDVPLPVEHTSDPEANRGKIVGMRLGWNRRGERALFGIVQFRDEDAAKLANSTDVSIYVPPDFTSGNGTRYERPIRHVALTTQPVIPGLDKFKTIAASFVPGGLSQMTPANLNEATTMVGVSPALQKIAQAMGIVAQDTGDDNDAVSAAIVDNFHKLQKVNNGLRASIKSLKMALAEIDDDEVRGHKPGQADAEGYEDDGEMSLEDNPFLDPEDEDVGESLRIKRQLDQVGGTQNVPPGLRASFGPILRENRERQLTDLVREGCIDRAVAADLYKQYCSDHIIALSLAHAAPNDDFHTLIATLKKNSRRPMHEQTGPQADRALALAHPDGSYDRDPRASSLVKNAERRASQAAATKAIEKSNGKS
jgi:hypothetical protein